MSEAYKEAVKLKNRYNLILNKDCVTFIEVKLFGDDNERYVRSYVDAVASELKDMGLGIQFLSDWNTIDLPNNGFMGLERTLMTRSVRIYKLRKWGE